MRQQLGLRILRWRRTHHARCTAWEPCRRAGRRWRAWTTAIPCGPRSRARMWGRGFPPSLCMGPSRMGSLWSCIAVSVLWCHEEHKVNVIITLRWGFIYSCVVKKASIYIHWMLMLSSFHLPLIQFDTIIVYSNLFYTWYRRRIHRRINLAGIFNRVQGFQIQRGQRPN